MSTGRMRRARDRLAAHWELGHYALRSGEHEAALDFVDATYGDERDLARARAESHAEFVERRADPDAVEYEYRVPDDAPGGWLDAPGGRDRLSPALSRRLAEAEQSEAFRAHQAAREREALAAARHEAAVTEMWQDDVCSGLAGVADLASYLEGRGGGRTRAEAIAEASARQDLEDRQARAAVERYGAAMLTRYGPNLTGRDLEQLLYNGDES